MDTERPGESIGGTGALGCLEPVARLLDEAVARGDFPAAQACVVADGVVAHSSWHGADHAGHPVGRESLFDLASVTKVMATTSLAAVLVARGALSLDASVDAIVSLGPGCTVRDLLAHQSGFPAWKPLFELARRDAVASPIYPPHDERRARHEAFRRARELVRSAALRTPFEHRGDERVYSDIGFIVLGEVLQAVGGADLPTLCRQLLYEPLGLSRTRFFDLVRPARGTRSRVAPEQAAMIPTGRHRPRMPAPGQESLYEVGALETPPLVGEVDDDNAYAMGGVAGHAGLFSNAEDVARFGAALLAEIDGAARLEAGDALARFAGVWPSGRATRQEPLLGFDLPTPGGSTGDALGQGPRGAIGHLGFTGTSLWIDLDQRVSIALLTNRVFAPRTPDEAPPSERQNLAIRAFRPAFHEAVMHALGPDRWRRRALGASILRSGGGAGGD